MIDSESGESRIPIPARGNGVTSLGGHPPRFLRVLYEGGRALPERGFRLGYLSDRGLIAPAKLSRKRLQGIEGVPKPI